MLPLNDPLWQKLDDAHRDRDIPGEISRLAQSWDEETAKSLLWDNLCHQGTCYGATYAAIPHLVSIAQRDCNPRQRLDIAAFAGHVALCAQNPREDLYDDAHTPHLQGLPETLKAWEGRRNLYRGMVASLERRPMTPYEQTKLPHYKKILAVPPVDVHDLEKIQTIRADFIAALPSIRALCERALLEDLEDRGTVLFLLSGIAACDGLLGLANLLEGGLDGDFRCMSCGQYYSYILFEDRVAIYTDQDSELLDLKAGAPSQADGFIAAARDADITDRRAKALLSLAEQATSQEPAMLLRNFLGSFRCSECEAQGPIHAG